MGENHCLDCDTGDDLRLDLSLTDDPGAMEDAADTFGEAGIEILFSPFDILVSHL